MAARKERQEPVFDTGRAMAGFDLRVAPEDRPGHVPGRRSERHGRNRGHDHDPHHDAPRGRPPRRRRGLFGFLFYWGFVLGFWGIVAALAVVAWYAAHLPPIQSLEVPRRPPDIRIVSLEGTLIANRGETGGAAVPIRDVPAYLPAAFIAIEDRRFREHFGLDLWGVARAVVANLQARGVAQGGSTLTQQLAKNLFLTQERTFERKVHELILALWLESKFSKDEILELYMNRVYFGSGAWGVEAASQRYFGKSARQVTLAEAAMLAGLVRSPSRLAPNRNPGGAQARATTVIAAMAETGAINDDMAKIAMMRPAEVVRGAAAGSAGYVADYVMDQLEDVIGRVEEDIVVTTTVDHTLQQVAEAALVEALREKGERFGVGQGAIVVMTPDGAVKALVGGRSHAESPFNRAVAARRQPGSAFKPFVYLAALERGLTPDTIRRDEPVEVGGWRPENYSREYRGNVTLTQALALSLNTVAVKVGLEVGPRVVAQTARRMGITSKLEANASIALGTSEVSPLELVSAYAPFANGGIAAQPFVIEKVRTAGGRTLWQRRAPGSGRVVAASIVADMNAMLQETLVTGTARTAVLPGWVAAGKTGTSQDFRDAWFVGYTASLVAGVWLGNDDASPTRRASGGGLPVEIWSRVMQAGLRGVPVANLPGLRGRTLAQPGVAPVALPGAGMPSPVGTPVGTTPSARGGARPPVEEDPTRPVREEQTLDRWLIDRLLGR